MMADEMKACDIKSTQVLMRAEFAAIFIISMVKGHERDGEVKL